MIRKQRVSDLFSSSHQTRGVAQRTVRLGDARPKPLVVRRPIAQRTIA